MNSSLIPERPILLYPTQAATLGLEESILLSVLVDLAAHAQTQLSGGFAWSTISAARLLNAVPFWSIQDLQRICHSLHAKGVLLVGASSLAEGQPFRFAFNERVAQGHTHQKHSNPGNSLEGNDLQSSTSYGHAAQNPAPHNHAPHNHAPHNHAPHNHAPHNHATQTGNPQNKPAVPPPIATSPGKNYIASNWQPDEMTLAQLAQHNIPDTFARDQVPEFVTYWRERGEPQRSWGAKFIQHVIRQWRQFEARRNRQEQNSRINSDWAPSLDAMEVLTVHAGIRREFVEDAVPEFVLYWRERGDALKTWNSKFIQHVRVQWKKYNSALENSTDPKPINDNWQPSEDVYDVLRLANIDINFARKLIPEFVIYWRDTGQVHTSWNTRFLQHCKREWARQHAITTPTGTENRSTREISLEEKLTDRSWAY